MSSSMSSTDEEEEEKEEEDAEEKEEISRPRRWKNALLASARQINSDVLRGRDEGKNGVLVEEQEEKEEEPAKLRNRSDGDTDCDEGTAVSTPRVNLNLAAMTRSG
jgi:hypothetical protein